MLCELWLLTLIYAGEWKEKTIISLIWFVETVSEVLDVAASSAHEENLDSVKEGVASAAQEISDTSSRSQDADAEELGQTSEGARAQLGLKCFVSEKHKWLFALNQLQEHVDLRSGCLWWLCLAL